MPTKPRTTKKPAKATRKPRQPKPTAEDIGRSIGDALGRRLESLLAKPDNPGFDAISAWTVEKLGDGDGVTGFTRAKYATEPPSSRISPIEEALRRLRDEISMAELSTDMSLERLDSLLCPSPPAPATIGPDTEVPLSGELASLLNSFADRIGRDNARRAYMLDRLEL